MKVVAGLVHHPLPTPRIMLPFGRNVIVSMAAFVALSGAGYLWTAVALLHQAAGVARWWDGPPGSPFCRRVPQRRRRIYAGWVALVSLPADLRPLRWRLLARRQWRHVIVLGIWRRCLLLWGRPER
jgi:hypothetical protein